MNRALIAFAVLWASSSSAWCQVDTSIYRVEPGPSALDIASKLQELRLRQQQMQLLDLQLQQERMRLQQAEFEDRRRQFEFERAQAELFRRRHPESGAAKKPSK